MNGLRTLTVTLLAAGLVTAPSLAASPATTDGPEPRRLNVAIAVYDGVEILDFAGPSEVFAAASGFARDHGEDAFRVYTVGATTAPVESQGFVTITPQYAVADAPAPDILVLPGGSSGSLTGNPAYMSWAKEAAAHATVTMTVCTGAFVLARAGALDGREATTWYGAIEALRRAAPRARVEEGRRFVDTGKVVTTAGVSAGIDGALHVVARLLGRYVADRTARYMEYHWTPEPYLAKSYSYLDPRLDDRGRKLQQAGILEDEGRPGDAVKAYRAVLDGAPGDPYAWYGLGVALAKTGDLEGAVEANRHAASSSKLRPRALYNAACASARLGRRDQAVAMLEQAVKSGFGYLRRIESDPDLESVRDDPRVRKLLGGKL